MRRMPIPWTDEETRILRELGPYHTATAIADVLKSRSAESIRSKAKNERIELGSLRECDKPIIDYGVAEILRTSAQ